LHPPPPAPPPPPACEAAAGRVTGHAPIVRYGHRPRVSGRARRVDGVALVSATVTVAPAGGAWTRTAVAGTDGRYAVRIPAGPSRTLSVQALAPGASSLACASIRVKTRAAVRLRATRRVRPGGRVRFRGRLLGRPIPRRGKLVELQAFDGGRWRVFAIPRARRSGRYHASYRLRRTFGPRTFRFRALVRAESGYPYALGYSRTVRVRVR
ncbi:MAG: carboxypeptidase-like regulatory domain-containing protein, partial [Solirubrobacteraceae bacterium]